MENTKIHIEKAREREKRGREKERSRESALKKERVR